MLLLRAPHSQSKRTWLSPKGEVTAKKAPQPSTYYALERDIETSELTPEALRDLLVEATQRDDLIAVIGSALTPDYNLLPHLHGIAQSKGMAGDYLIRRKDWNYGICESNEKTADLEAAHRMAPGSLILVPTHILSFDVENLPERWLVEDGFDTTPEGVTRWFCSVAPELEGVACVVMFTAGHGFRGEVRARLSFLSEAPLTQPEVRWLTDVFRARAQVAYSHRQGWTKAVIDLAASSRHQAWYVAAPRFFLASDPHPTAGRARLPDPIQQRIHLVPGADRVGTFVLRRAIQTKPTPATPPVLRAAMERNRPRHDGLKTELTKYEYSRRLRLPKDMRANPGYSLARLTTAINVISAGEGNRHTTAAREGYNMGWLDNLAPKHVIDAEGLRRLLEEADSFFDPHEPQHRTLGDQFTVGNRHFRVPYIPGLKVIPRGTSAWERARYLMVRRICKKILGLWRTALPTATVGLYWADVETNERLDEVMERWRHLRYDFDSFPSPHGRAHVPGQGDVVTVHRQVFDSIRLEVMQQMARDGLDVPAIEDRDIAEFFAQHGIEDQRCRWASRGRNRTYTHTCAHYARTSRALRSMHGGAAAADEAGQIPLGYTDNQMRGFFNVKAIEETFGWDRNQVEPYFAVSDPTIPPAFPDDTSLHADAIRVWRMVQLRMAHRAILRVSYHNDVHVAVTGRDCPHAREHLQAIARSVLWAVTDAVTGLPIDGDALNGLDVRAGRRVADDVVLPVTGHDFESSVWVLMACADGADPTDWLPTEEALARVARVAEEGAREATRRKFFGAAAWLQERLSHTDHSPSWLDQMVMHPRRRVWGHTKPLVVVRNEDDSHIFGEGITLEELGVVAA